MNQRTALCLAGLLLAAAPPAHAGDLFDGGRLLATGGVTQVEGAAGAGLTTWAVITGYGTEHGVGVNAHHTFVALDDFTFNASGVAVGLFDRVELSYTHQWFDTRKAGGRLGLGDGFTFSQDVVGAKVRLLGDAVYDQDTWLPQIAVGLQYKHAAKSAVLAAVGAGGNDGTDFYIAATKVLLRQSLLLDVTARLTKANQFGLLGFGNAGGADYRLEWEFSAVYLITRRLVGGIDYRTKPDNLAFAHEGDAAAVYLAWFAGKNLSVTLAGVDLGPIALQGRQRGVYLSVQAGF
ncbi:MAG: DUF3034 family protein [Alphaproteobacteria bacterium]|nr:DUF3034 family protein [Alphaproteobacteria bacterium]